jgi:hypothetical protein
MTGPVAKSSRSISPKDIKRLWALSGALCAFPDCKMALIDSSEEPDPIVIGEMAHVISSSDSGPNPDPTFPTTARDEYDNLVLLCPTHHTLVDKGGPTIYPPSTIKAWKADLEASVHATLERWKDGRLFLALTRDQTLESIAFYNEAIQFDYSNPNDYRRLQFLLSKQNLFTYWCDLAKAGVNDNRELYELGDKLAGYMRIVGLVDEATAVYKQLEGMLRQVFDPSTVDFKNHSRSLMHNLYGRFDKHEQEVEFCVHEFGELHVHTIASMTCRGCVLMRNSEYKAAEAVLADCSTSLERLPEGSTVRSAYLSLQLGKLNYFLALTHRKSPDHLQRAIHHLTAALDYFTLVREDHVTKNYVHFFLFKTFTLSGEPDRARNHLIEARRFFSSTPIRNMCHYDFHEMEGDLKLS